MFAEGAAPAGDLSEEVDEVQSCSVRLPGEEEGYDADSESNPETMKQQEEGRSTHKCTLKLCTQLFVTANLNRLLQLYCFLWITINVICSLRLVFVAEKCQQTYLA